MSALAQATGYEDIMEGVTDDKRIHEMTRQKEVPRFFIVMRRGRKAEKI